MDKREPKKLQVHGKFAKTLTVTFTFNDDGAVDSDKTYTDIRASHDAGMNVVGVISNDPTGTIMPLSGVSEDEVVFALLEISNTSLSRANIRVYANGGVTYDGNGGNLVPPLEDEIRGWFLRCDGKWMPPPEQKQSDWAQNDPTAKDYVRNRPCYEDEIEEVFERTLYGAEYLVDAEFCENLWKNRYTATFVVNGVECPYNPFNDKVTETYRTIRLNVPGADSPTKSHGICWHKSSGSDVFDKIMLTSSFFTKAERANATTTISFSLKTKILRELDEKFIPDSIARTADIPEAIDGRMKPLLLAADEAETYLNDAAYGDKTLAAIKSGRQILVRVPNADGGDYTAIYSPIMMYQVPNRENKYLYLFFLRDEKQDLSALLGQPAGTVHMPTYGQLKMLLSQEYNSNPLET